MKLLRLQWLDLLSKKCKAIYVNKESDDVSDYHVEVKYSEYKGNSPLSGEFKSEIFLSDNNSAWKATLDSLKTSYIRDKKIDILFDDDEE